MTPQFVLPSPTRLRFVAVNPNIDTLSLVPLADGSPDLLFVVFGQGSAADLDALLARAQDSLDTSTTDYRSAWILLRGDGMAMFRTLPSYSTCSSLGSESHSVSLHGRVTPHNIQLSDIKTPEFKVPCLLPCFPYFTNLG